MNARDLTYRAIRSLARAARGLGAAAAAGGEPAPLLELEKVARSGDE
jgi:hypothetical protein